MKIVFLLDYSFPASSPSSNRIESMSKGIALDKDNEVVIISFMSTFRKPKDVSYENNICVELSSNNGLRSENYLVRNTLKAIDRIRVFGKILSEHKKSKIDVVFLPIRNSVMNTLFFLVFKFLKVKTVHERSEYPEIYSTSFFSALNYHYYRKVVVKHLDGIVVMTNALYKYFKGLVKKNAIMVILPMSVDIERFDRADLTEKKEKYIAYCGNLSNRKDGVDILIKAFSIFSGRHDDYKLMIIGGSSDETDIDYLKSLCEENSISQKVIFTGRVDKDEIPDYLNKASMLALARPSSLQAAGGFPSKLGEYLATKNPVVVTATGEVANYLKDGISAFVSEPDSVEAFADKMIECANDPERSKHIALRGYEAAYENFYYLSQSKKLNDFLEELIK